MRTLEREELLLKLMKDLDGVFSGPETWNRGKLAIDKYGRAVGPTDKDACSFCILGAMNKVDPLLQLCNSFVSRISGFAYVKFGTDSIISVNDGCIENFDQLKEFIRECIEKQTEIVETAKIRWS